MPNSRLLASCLLRRFAVVCLAVLGTIPMSLAADSTFPFDKELLLDVKPMKGSKRVPILGIGPKGETAIDLWCNSVEAQIVVVDSTITILTGQKTERQCDPARMRGDDDLLAALQQVTSWRREGDVLMLRGGKTLRFRQATN
jgi:heat shock protein HslJ